MLIAASGALKPTSARSIRGHFAFLEFLRCEAAAASLMPEGNPSKLLIRTEWDKESKNEEFPPWIPISQGNCLGRN
jgi:hypothetical protein